MLARLARLNPTTTFLAALVYVLIALFAPGIIGGGMLLLLAAGLAALLVTTDKRLQGAIPTSSMSRPIQPPRTRVLRLVSLGLVLTAALTKIF